MKFSNILPNKNSFSEKFEQHYEQQFILKLQEKYEVKPFHKRYKALRLLSFGSSYLINAFSIATACISLFAIIRVLTGDVLAVCLSLMALIALEAFKRLLVPNIAKDWLQFSKVNIFKALGITTLLTASIFLSWKGANDSIKLFAPKANTIDLSQKQQPYNQRLNELKNRLAEVKRTQSWKGSLTPIGQRNYTTITNQIAATQKQLDTVTNETATKNNSIEVEHNNTVFSNAALFGAMAFCLDVVLILLLVFIEYYDYRTLVELTNNVNTNIVYNKNEYVLEDKERTVPKPLPMEKEAERTVIKGFISDAPLCENCKKPFVKNAPKHKFCSDDCRVTNWQKANGRQVFKKPKNGYENNIPIEGVQLRAF